jgi:hypothetical protein
VGVVAVAFAPGAPVLVPEVASGAAGELAQLRAACLASVRRVLDCAPARVVVVGGDAGDHVTSFPEGSLGTFAGVGVPLEVRLGRPVGTAGAPLPLTLTLGAWLLDAAGWAGPTDGLALGVGADAVGAGKQLRDCDVDLALVVIGDGSARLTTASPGYVHPDAVRWQRAVAEVFRRGDASALLDLDADRAVQLMASGWAPWQLASASLGDASISVPVFATDERYGVGYIAAAWIAS